MLRLVSRIRWARVVAVAACGLALSQTLTLERERHEREHLLESLRVAQETVRELAEAEPPPSTPCAALFPPRGQQATVTWSFQETPLAEVADDLSDLLGARVHLEGSLGADTVTLRLREVPLADALEVLAEHVGAEAIWTQRDLARALVFRPAAPVLEIYDVSDLLLERDEAELLGELPRLVREDCSLELYRGQLIASLPLGVQRRVRYALRRLRVSQATWVEFPPREEWQELIRRRE